MEVRDHPQPERRLHPARGDWVCVAILSDCIINRRYVGLWGALLGMSAEGLTVHEANLEEDEITFLGFPWVSACICLSLLTSNSCCACAM